MGLHRLRWKRGVNTPGYVVHSTRSPAMWYRAHVLPSGPFHGLSEHSYTGSGSLSSSGGSGPWSTTFDSTTSENGESGSGFSLDFYLRAVLSARCQGVRME
jgi:hypothetical protein